MFVAHDPPAYVTVTYWTSAGRVVMAALRQEVLAALAARWPVPPRCCANRTHRLKVRTAADRPRRPSRDVRASHTSPRRSHLAGLANVTAGGGGGSRGGAAVVVTPPVFVL
ncbi:hypothetical protein C0Q70_05685 [Pomacea canaliculata]|uniref:Uncharacterized protein n=1 Tax=Pomacea canaliculata TaxID=400727 RepID=A0A2T7PLV9_POMCA|nr:hypothetical protein C0Q70_05685 [Pomacea canaliculata]